MKKTRLSKFTHFNTVEILDIQKLHCLRGGCGGEEGSYPKPRRDDETQGDDGCSGGGEEGFIPPPGK